MRRANPLDGIDFDGLPEEQVARLRDLYTQPAGEPVTTRCAFCSFEMIGPFEATRDAFLEHECERPQRRSLPPALAG